MNTEQLREVVNVKSVGAYADLLRSEGNIHPSIRDVEMSIIAWIKSLGEEEEIDPEIYTVLNEEVTYAFKGLRAFFLKQDSIVVPYNRIWPQYKFVKPATKFQARMFLTGPHYPLFGILFITEIDHPMNLAYNDVQDERSDGKRFMNNRRNILGIEQNLISEARTADRIKGHLERSKGNIEKDITRFQSYKKS